ncbi:MAG: LysM peptidoglycan-binding domain-containing protein [Peptococcaceae bacterium]|nr:LysM peptidoglycan-binding domain-containing protein [Peptococcaceae bacterium]
MIWLVGNGEKLEVIAVTDSLGTSVSALAASEGETSRLAAGTPEGYVFVFNYPVKKSPDLAFGVREGISGLAVLPRERVAAGTALGGVQVWSLAGGDPEKRYIVGPGDTLWSIAGRFGVTVDQILAVNQGIMNRDLILPGQIIRIPLPR